MAVLEWCKLLGDPRDRHYWKKVVTDPSHFEALAYFRILAFLPTSLRATSTRCAPIGTSSAHLDDVDNGIGIFYRGTSLFSMIMFCSMRLIARDVALAGRFDGILWRLLCRSVSDLRQLLTKSDRDRCLGRDGDRAAWTSAAGERSTDLLAHPFDAVPFQRSVPAPRLLEIGAPNASLVGGAPPPREAHGSPEHVRTSLSISEARPDTNRSLAALRSKQSAKHWHFFYASQLRRRLL